MERKVSFVTLERSLHNRTLGQELYEPSLVPRVQQVDLKPELVANMESIEWRSFDDRDSRHEPCLVAVEIPAICDCECTIN